MEFNQRVFSSSRNERHRGAEQRGGKKMAGKRKREGEGGRRQKRKDTLFPFDEKYPQVS